MILQAGAEWVIASEPEYITSQDGKEKQGYETVNLIVLEAR